MFIRSHMSLCHQDKTYNNWYLEVEACLNWNTMSCLILHSGLLMKGSLINPIYLKEDIFKYKLHIFYSRFMQFRLFKNKQKKKEREDTVISSWVIFEGWEKKNPRLLGKWHKNRPIIFEKNNKNFPFCHNRYSDQCWKAFVYYKDN